MKKNIWESNDLLGGYEFRVMSYNDQVYIESRKDGAAKWRVKYTANRAAWEDFVEEFDVHNPYNDNAAHAQNFIKREHA